MTDDEFAICPKCGEGLMQLARSTRYERDGERWIHLEFRCAACSFLDEIDARIKEVTA